MEFDTGLPAGRIRVATVDDAEAVERLWDGYAAALAAYDDRYLIDEGGRERWRRYFENSLVNSSRSDVLLAERDGRGIGVIEVRVVGGHPVFKFGKHGQVYGHFVDPEHRREGVGEALVEAAEEWFRDRDLPFYRYDALRGMAPDGFYEALGMEAVETVFEKRL